VLIVVAISLFAYIPRTKASVTFSANFDDSLNANLASGDAEAYTDGTFPSLVSGYAGNGQAVQNTFGTTLKYKTNNLNQSSDNIEFKFQLPFGMEGDTGQGKVADGYSTITYDYVNDYVYVADDVADRVFRTRMDGTGWKEMGARGSGKGQFKLEGSGSISMDTDTELMYIMDTGNSRVVRSRIDGTGWETFGTYGSGVNQFDEWGGRLYFDETSDYLFIYDRPNNRLVKTKFGGEGWQELGSISDYVTSIRDLAYDNATGLIYLSDGANGRMVRLKIDGSEYATFGTEGSGVNQFDNLYGIELAGDYFYCVDEDNYRLVKTKWGGDGWQTYGGTRGVGEGKFWDPLYLGLNPNTGDMYVLDYAARAQSNFSIIKTKIDGTGWQGYGSNGIGSISQFNQVIKDETADDYYFAPYGANIIKSKLDGTGWQSYGSLGNGVTPGTFSYITGIDKSSTGDIYAIDHYINGIIKTKMDGSTWEVYKGPNGNDFSTPRGIAYDEANDYIYAGAMFACKIIKTKMDGTGWDTFGSCGDGDGQFSQINRVIYDDISGWIYATDFTHTKITRFKMDGGDPQTQVLDLSSVISYAPTFTIEPGTDYIYTDTDAGTIMRTKMDGTNQTFIDFSGWAEAPLYPTPALYESDTNTVLMFDYQSLYRSTPSGEFVEKFNASPNKVLLKSSGTNPLELEISPYNGRFNLSLNKYELPIEYSEAQTMTAGSWHDIKVTFDRSAGTMNVYLDGNDIPIIQKTGLSSQSVKTMSDIGDYIYIGSDPDDPNRTFPGAIDDLTFGINPAAESSSTSTSTSSIINGLIILPETGL
jgi:hypothetical protein